MQRGLTFRTISGSIHEISHEKLLGSVNRMMETWRSTPDRSCDIDGTVSGEKTHIAEVYDRTVSSQFRVSPDQN